MHVLSYLEYLVIHGVSVHMLANHISTCKAKFTMYGLQFHLWDHPNVRYLLKSVKINRPIVVTKKHIIDLDVLNDIVTQCDSMYLGRIFKAVFLLAFFGFLKLSNIVPHSLTSFDSSRHLCAGDLIFTKHFLKVVKPFRPGTKSICLLSPGLRVRDCVPIQHTKEHLNYILLPKMTLCFHLGRTY